MSPSRRFKFLFAAVVAAQIVILIWLAAGRYLILAGGESALLRTVPYDPYHLMMGNYVQLNYTVSEIEFSEHHTDIEDLDQIGHGESVYVVWTKGGKYHEATGLYRNRPVVADDQLLVKARFLWHYDGKVRVEYGIERFYVPDGQGKHIEKPSHTIEVEVKVGKRGDVAIHRVFLDGEELPFS